MQTDRIPSNVEDMPGQEGTFQNARQRLNEGYEVMRQRAGEAYDYTDQMVRANPWTSIGVGFGVGILVGALVALAAGSNRRSHLIDY